MNQNVQQPEISSTIQCPTCSTNRLYQLADGRLKCALCRRVFSAADNRHARLDAKTRQALAAAFHRMTGTAETAQSLKLNIKTVQKYFSIMRDNFYRLSRQKAIACLGTDSINVDLFETLPSRKAFGLTAAPIAAIAGSADGIHLLIADRNAPRSNDNINVIGWIYAQDDTSRQKLNLDRIHCRPGGPDTEELTTPFWRFIKQGLIHYQGGFRHHFTQFLREMEFRYNDRQEQHGYDICLRHLAVE